MEIDREHIYGNIIMRPTQSAHIVDGGASWGWFDVSFIEVLIIAAIVAILGAAGFGIYQDSQRPTFALKKDDWSCTKSHEESTTTYINQGDGKTIILIPITTYSTVCDNWSRRK